MKGGGGAEIQYWENPLESDIFDVNPFIRFPFSSTLFNTGAGLPAEGGDREVQEDRLLCDSRNIRQ